MISKFIEDVEKNKLPVALITGASGYLGASCVKMFARNGYATLLLGRDKEKLENLQFEINQTSDNQASFLKVLDVRDPTAIEEFSNEISKLKAIDVLLLAAGITSNSTSKFDLNELKGIVETNMISPILVTKFFLGQLFKSKQPYIINIASRSGIQSFSDKGLYGATKAATIRFFDSLRLDCQSENLRITSICPSWINTPMAIRGGCTLPADQLLQPDDVTSAIEWLIKYPPHIVIKELIIETRCKVITSCIT